MNSAARLGIKGKILLALLGFFVLAFFTANVLWAFSSRPVIERHELQNQEGIAWETVLPVLDVGYLNIAILLFVVGVAVAVGASLWFANRLAHPVQELHKGVEQIRKGNLSYRADIRTKDEVEDLAKAFNHMLDDLEKSRMALEESEAVLKVRVLARTRELEELAKSLDLKVKDKTKELEQKVKELEKFNKLAVKRELKMIELKKELQEAKESNGNRNS
ncbi:MAG: HAMP domain-containing protein [bacterium]|nr:HAMP domain-containing protein [bacterium]